MDDATAYEMAVAAFNDNRKYEQMRRQAQARVGLPKRCLTDPAPPPVKRGEYTLPEPKVEVTPEMVKDIYYTARRRRSIQSVIDDQLGADSGVTANIIRQRRRKFGLPSMGELQ